MADDLRAVNPRARLFRTILAVYGVGIYLFLFAPIAVLVLLSFNSSRVVGFPMAGFTTDWYARLPQDRVILEALTKSLVVAFWVTLPFVILVVSSRLEALDRNLERAAADLGAGPVQRLLFVVLPLIYPGIVAGALIAATLSLDEFVVTNFIIGADQTLPIYIYNQLKFGITPEVNALATMMLIGTLAVVAVTFLALRLTKVLASATKKKKQLEAV